MRDKWRKRRTGKETSSESHDGLVGPFEFLTTLLSCGILGSFFLNLFLGISTQVKEERVEWLPWLDEVPLRLDPADRARQPVERPAADNE